MAIGVEIYSTIPTFHRNRNLLNRFSALVDQPSSRDWSRNLDHYVGVKQLHNSRSAVCVPHGQIECPQLT